MDVEKSHIEQAEERSQGSSDKVDNVAHTKGGYVPNEARDDDVVTMKTWTVVIILSASYGLSFWMIPALAAIQGQVSVELGNAENAAWWTTV